MKKPQPEMDDDEIDVDLRRASYRRERRVIQVHIDDQRQPASQHACRYPPPTRFYAGEQISGYLSVEIEGGLPVKQVKVALVCLQQIRSAPPSLRQQPPQQPQSRRKSIFNAAVNAFYGTDEDSERKIYFDRYIILQMDILEPDKKLTDGKYELPFRFWIPTDDLPSSVKTAYGLVKYTVEGFTIGENRSESRGEREIIMVMIPTILQQRQISNQAKTETMDTMVNNMTFTARLDRRIYIPGDTLILEWTIEMLNDNNKNGEVGAAADDQPTTLDTIIIGVQQRQVLRFPDDEQQQIVDQNLLPIVQVATTMENDDDDDGDALNDDDDDQPNVMKRRKKRRESKRCKIGPLPKKLPLSVECPILAVKYLVRIMLARTANIPDFGPTNTNNSMPQMEIPFLVTGSPPPPTSPLPSK